MASAAASARTWACRGRPPTSPRCGRSRPRWTRPVTSTLPCCSSNPRCRERAQMYAKYGVSPYKRAPSRRISSARALDADRVAQLLQELLGVVASDDVVRDRDPDDRRGPHRGIGSGEVPLQAVAHLRDDAAKLGDGVLGFDVDHAHPGVRMLVLDD